MRATRLHLALIPLLVIGCAPIEEEASQSLSVENTGDAVSPANPLRCDGVWLAYLASEQGNSEDLNLDEDTDDQVAILVNTSSGERTNLGVACESMAFLNETLFLVVSEAGDGRDWDVDPQDNTVLLFVDTAAEELGAELLPGHPETDGLFAEASAQEVMAVVGESLLFCIGQTSVGGDETNLMYTTVSSTGAEPDSPAALTHSGPLFGSGVYLSILEVVEGLAFLTMDEAYGASEDPGNHDYNDDGDVEDSVLALWDGVRLDVTPTFMAVNSGEPVDALQHSGSTEWTAAFLVDEGAQGVNLNPNTEGQPGACAFDADDDEVDLVLHWCLYTDLAGSPDKEKIINTELVAGGLEDQSVYVMATGEKRFVGCVSREDDQGPNGCDLNGDGDTQDWVFRWVEATDPLAGSTPVVQQSMMHAVAREIEGPQFAHTGGVVALNDSWVIAVDEFSDGGDALGVGSALAVLDPAGEGTWDFDQVPIDYPEGDRLRVTWMARDSRSRDSFQAAFTEASIVDDRNNDDDVEDSIPSTWTLGSHALQGSAPYLACEMFNAGVSKRGGNGIFFRLSEADQRGADLNKDGDQDDSLLWWVTDSGEQGGYFVETLNDLPIPAVQFSDQGAISFGAFLFQEGLVGASGKDKNSDDDTSDYVVHYFTFS